MGNGYSLFYVRKQNCLVVKYNYSLGRSIKINHHVVWMLIKGMMNGYHNSMNSYSFLKWEATHNSTWVRWVQEIQNKKRLVALYWRMKTPFLNNGNTLLLFMFIDPARSAISEWHFKLTLRPDLREVNLIQTILGFTSKKIQILLFTWSSHKHWLRNRKQKLE